MFNKLAFYLKVSRPGLWFQTLWLYLVPTAQMDLWHQPAFWLGLLYMAFPINFLMYGWNDRVDRETDRLNQRKDSYLWGARGNDAQLDALPPIIALVQAPFLLAFLLLGAWLPLALIVAMILANWLYNLPKHGWRGKPPLELVNVLAMLLILPFSSFLNHQPQLPQLSVLYLALFCLKAHLIGEVMDIQPDSAAGRATTAVRIGATTTKLLIMALLLLEACLLTLGFHEYVLGLFLFLALPWLVFDLLVLSRKPYTLLQFRWMGLGLNLSGYLSILWVWHSGTLAA